MKNGTKSGLGYLTIALVLLLPAVAGAEKPEGKGQPGGKALEHRSELAAERANSQWEETATQGKERADEVREEAEGQVDRVRGKKDETNKAAKDAEKEAR